MIARPKISRNEWKTAESGAFEVGNFAPFSCPGFDDAKGGVAGFVAGARALGFDEVRRDAKNKMFVAFVFRKADRAPDAAKLAKVGFAFRACLYKKR
jgi:hypothetical protein